MSRNKREGKYYGWSLGHHIRDWDANKVDSWKAFRKAVSNIKRKNDIARRKAGVAS